LALEHLVLCMDNFCHLILAFGDCGIAHANDINDYFLCIRDGTNRSNCGILGS
jgi:hypothetical protein